MRFFGNKYKILILALLSVTFIKGILWATFTPIFQAPDEPTHYLYIQYLAEFGRLPEREVFFYPDESAIVKNLLEFDKTRHTGMKPEYISGLTGVNEGKIESLAISQRTAGINQEHAYGIAQNYPPLYYVVGAVFYKIFYNSDFINRFFAIRICFLFLPILTVFLAYKIAFEFFHKEKAALTVATLVSFLPQYSFVSSVINNDNLLICASALFIYCSFRIINKGINNKRSVALGAAAGLALLTKPQALILVLTGLLVIFILKRKTAVPTLFKSALIIFFMSLSIAGWWYLSGLLEYGSFMGPKTDILHPEGGHISFLFLAGYAILYVFMLITDFLGEFGWADVFLPDKYYSSFALLLVASFSGIIYLFFKKKLFSQHRDKLIFCLICILSFFVVILGLSIMAIVKVGYFGAYNQVRSYFPLLPLMFIILILPIEYLKNIKIKNAIYFLITLYFIAINLLSLFNYLVFGFYA